MKKELTVNGLKVTLTENPGKPLLLLTRRAVHEMGLWEKIWDYLTPCYTVATFSLPVVDIDTMSSATQVFNYLARNCLIVGEGLGYEKFHLFGWGGGAQVALRCMVDFPEHLHSCILMGAAYADKSDLSRQKSAAVLKTILDTGNLELYTYYWLLSGFSPKYISEHFDEVETLANNRLKADKSRVDTNKVWRWLTIQGQSVATDDELRSVNTPTLIVAPAFDYNSRLSDMRMLHSIIPTSEIAVIPDGTSLVLYEDPSKFMAVASAFLRKMAAKKENKPL